MSAFPDRAVAQSVVVVKAICQGLRVVPLSVELVEGTSAEGEAWEREAEKYLIARAKGVRYKPDVRDLNEEIFGDD